MSLSRKDVILLLREVFHKLGRVETETAALIWDGDEDLKIGDAVYVEAEDGELKPAENGEYKTADGKVIIVADGVVAEINDPEAEVSPEEQPEQMAEEQPEVDPEPAPEPEPNEVDVIKQTMAELLNQFKAMQDEIEELKETVNQLLAAPQAEEAFSKQTPDSLSKSQKLEQYINNLKK